MFLSSVRVVAAGLGASSFLTMGRSRCRPARRSDLLQKTLDNDKSVEPDTTKVKSESSSSSSSTVNLGKAADEAKQENAKPAAQEGTGDANDPITFPDEFIKDDIENAILGVMPLYYKPDSSTEMESNADSVIRMKLYRQLTLATPNHTHKVRNNPEGDCYGYMKLCLVNVLTTASSHFLAMSSLGRLTFKDGKTINELATELTELQMKANRIQPNSVTDELLKGALLSLTLPHPRFKQLATGVQQDHVRRRLQHHPA